jgi:6,7-dimethyl-8-ribityllumazine synthase
MTSRLIEADNDVQGSTIAIVMSKYNSYIVDSLLRGCLEVLHAKGIDDSAITLVKVPGAFEIPVAAHKLAAQRQHDAIITLGAVIRGETPHFDYISASCSEGVNRVALDFDLPVIFGVLTVDNVQQAQDRAGASESNKGAEAALTAVEMIRVMRKIGS